MKSSKNKKIKIIEYLPSLNIGGAEQLGKSLYEKLDRSKFDPILVSLYENSKSSQLKKQYFSLGKKRRGISLRAIMRFRQFLSHEKPDLIHSHSLLSLFYVVCANFGRNKAIVVQTIHSDLRFYLRPLIFWKLFFSIFDIQIVNLASCLNSSFQKSHRNTNISNGINHRKYSKIQTAQFDTKTILSIGRLTNVKNPLLILEIFHSIIKQDENFRLILIGSGKLERKIAKKIQQKGLQKKIKFINKVVDPEKYFGEASYFLISSRWEGMPLVVLEAMASGLVVFTSNVGAVADLISNERDGFIYSCKSPDVIASYILSKCGDKRKLLQIAYAAKKKAEKFSDESMTRNYEKLFRKLLMNSQ